MQLKVKEKQLTESKAELISHTKQADIIHIHWLENNLVKTNGPLANDPEIKKCLALQSELDAKREDVADVEKEAARLAQRQDRLRKNIKSGGQDELTNRWRAELDEAEQSIRRIEEETFPALAKDEKAIRACLIEALRSLAAEWSEVG